MDFLWRKEEEITEITLNIYVFGASPLKFAFWPTLLLDTHQPSPCRGGMSPSEIKPKQILWEISCWLHKQLSFLDLSCFIKKKKKIIISHLVLHDILDAFLNYPGECFNLSRCPELKQGILRFDTAKMMGLLWSCFLAHLLPLESKVSKEDKKVDLLYLPA